MREIRFRTSFKVKTLPEKGQPVGQCQHSNFTIFLLWADNLKEQH